MTDNATRAAKVFLGVASVAGTLGGWAVLASNEPSPTTAAEPALPPAAVATPATQPVSTANAPAKHPAASVPKPRARTVPITYTRSSR